MSIQLSTRDPAGIVQIQSGVLKTERDVTDLIGLFGEANANGLLLTAQHLPEEFFDLKSGFAGMMLQKFANYGVRAAIVVPPESLTGRFNELAAEASWGEDFRIVTDGEFAKRWLSSK